MLTVRGGPVAGVLALVALLAVLGTTLGLSGAGWAVGLLCGVLLNAAVAVGLVRTGHVLGPADVVTLARATLACGVAALTVDSHQGEPAVRALVGIAAVALSLDAVDGWLARRTGTASRFGARFDGEIDAFLLLVLSVYVARPVGAWVLAIGLARYVFAVAGWVLPWMRRQLPPRYWRKPVTAVQGIVLTTSAADVLPSFWINLALLAALALLAESFGRDVWWLWRRREAEDRRRDRRVVGAATTTLALALVWFALLAPNRTGELTVGAFLRLPVEGVVLAALALMLPAAGRRIVAVAAGVVLGLLSMLKVLDMAFFTALDRSFNPVTDRGYLGPGLEFVRDGFGPFMAALTVAAAVVLAIVFLLGLPLALDRLLRLVADHRAGSARAVAAVAAFWVGCALTGVQIAHDEPVASSSAGRLTLTKLQEGVADATDMRRFEAAAAADGYRETTDLLAGLRGKDVLLVFVESYGRSVIDGPRASSEVRSGLDGGTRRLERSGFASRSAFLTSPTFGGLSWLAHSTLQSGLWIDNQLRYTRLLEGDRLTLTRAFGREGWRTVGLMPSNRDPWPEGREFYGFDDIYGRADLGYAGPRFGWSAMPDQFALAAFHRLELEPRNRAPVMAEVDLTSCHSPWTPLPRMVEWQALGNGSIFEGVGDRSVSAEELWRRPVEVREAYAESIAYCLEVVVSFVERYGDDDLVLVVLGDHQPAPIVSGQEVSHDVPITVISGDPAVLERISGWGWQQGLRPGGDAPVWPMDSFRDRFLAAYSERVPGSSQAVGPPRP